MDSPKIGDATAAAWKLAYLADHVIGVAENRARACERMEPETRSQYDARLIEATRALLKAFESAVNVVLCGELDRFRAVYGESAKMAGIKRPSWHDLAIRFASKVHLRVLPWGYKTGMDIEQVLLDAEALGEAVEGMERPDLEELLANLEGENAGVTVAMAKARSESKNIARRSRTPLKGKKKRGGQKRYDAEQDLKILEAWESSTLKIKKKRGGQKRYDAEQDLKILEAWESSTLKMTVFVGKRELFRKLTVKGKVKVKKKVPIWPPDSEDMTDSEREERAIMNLKAALKAANRERLKKSKSP